MRNKLWSIVVIAVMLALLLSACGPQATEPPPTEAPAKAEPTKAEPAEPSEKVTLTIESWRNDDLSIWQDSGNARVSLYLFWFLSLSPYLTL